METKNTPGPWRYVATNSSPTAGQHLVAGAIPGYIAEVRDCGSGDVRANARLIAAAPDLLAALQGLVERGTDSPEHQAAERAIAKATGE